MTVESIDKLTKVLDRLIDGTKNGKISWEAGYSGSYQTNLANQSIVIRQSLQKPILEIRDGRGDLVQQVGQEPGTISIPELEKALVLQNPHLYSQRSKVRTDPVLEDKVADLFIILTEHDYKLDATLDNLLEALEN